MRAFMSPIRAFHVPINGEVIVYGDGTRMLMTDALDMDACAEARAILRHSEPDTGNTASFGIERVQGCGREDGRGRVSTFVGFVALAEALAAFVAVDWDANIAELAKVGRK